jgi:hypothetical protein
VLELQDPVGEFPRRKRSAHQAAPATYDDIRETAPIHQPRKHNANAVATAQQPHLTYTRHMLTFDSRQYLLPLSPRLSHPSMYTHTYRISHHHSHHT